MLSSQVTYSVTSFIEYDPAADKELPVFIAPQVLTITGIKLTVPTAIAADGTNYFGASAKVGSDTVGAAVGGADVAWVALTPKSMTINTDNSELAAGDVLTIAYDENGTGTFAAILVQVDYKLGTAN